MNLRPFFMQDIDLAGLVERRNTWVAHNFPSQGSVPSESIIGMAEECGELAHSYLKAKQGIRGTQDGHDANLKDAIGDITVYMLGVMQSYGVPDMQQTWRDQYNVGKDLERAILALWATAGSTAHFYLTPLTVKNRNAASDNWVQQNVCRSVIEYLCIICSIKDWRWDDIVIDTWNAVETRDWIKYPDTGRPPGYGTEQELQGVEGDVRNAPDIT